MKPIRIKNPKKLRKEIESLPFIKIEGISGYSKNYNILCKNCDDWFARWRRLNLLGGYDAENNELILIEKLDLHYINFKQLFKFLEVVKKYG